MPARSRRAVASRSFVVLGALAVGGVAFVGGRVAVGAGGLAFVGVRRAFVAVGRAFVSGTLTSRAGVLA
jgi:hypothetical protein